MASTSFVAISHFAGFAQILQEIARDPIEYDETVAPRPTVDCTTPGCGRGSVL
jgi:hypothetical protein